MQVNLASTVFAALGLESSASVTVRPTDVSTVASTEAAATGAQSKEEQKLDSALASAISALISQVSTASTDAAKAKMPDALNTEVAYRFALNTEAAKTPAYGDARVAGMESDLVSVGTTAAGTPVASETQPTETSVREASAVPRHGGEAPDSILPAFEPKDGDAETTPKVSADDDLYTIAERFAKEVASRLAKVSTSPVKPETAVGTTVAPTRESAASERMPDKTKASENLPPVLKRLLSRMPTEVRELITTLRGLSHRMLRDGASFSEVASIFRAALRSTVRYAHEVESGTQLRDRPTSPATSEAAVTIESAVAEASTEAAREPFANIFSKRGDRLQPPGPTEVGDVVANPGSTQVPDMPTDVRTLWTVEQSTHPWASALQQTDDTKTEVADVHAMPYSVSEIPPWSQPDTVAEASTEVRYQSVASKVLERIPELASHGGKRTLTIRLDPPELGTVDITVHSRGSKVEAQILAANSEVRFAVESGRHALTEALARHGLELSSLLVGSDRSGGGANRYTESAFQTPAYRFDPEGALKRAVERSAARWAWQVGALDYVI